MINEHMKKLAGIPVTEAVDEVETLEEARSDADYNAEQIAMHVHRFASAVSEYLEDNSLDSISVAGDMMNAIEKLKRMSKVLQKKAKSVKNESVEINEEKEFKAHAELRKVKKKLHDTLDKATINLEQELNKVFKGKQIRLKSGSKIVTVLGAAPKYNVSRGYSGEYGDDIEYPEVVSVWFRVEDESGKQFSVIAEDVA